MASKSSYIELLRFSKKGFVFSTSIKSLRLPNIDRDVIFIYYMFLEIFDSTIFIKVWALGAH